MGDKILGLKIKQLRSDYGLKIGKKFLQKDLAEAVGVSRGYIGDIESGRTTPNETLLGKIADVFDIDIFEIIGVNGNIDLESTTYDEYTSPKVKGIIRKIDDKTAIKKYIKETDLTELLDLILEKNTSSISLNNIRNNLNKLSTIESDEFKAINGIHIDTHSVEASAVGYKYKSRFYNNLVDKILKIIELEDKNINELLIFKNKDIAPIAAHNDFANDPEEQKLMKDDLDNL
ncbi:helix-turn-helix domain-containing protein [Clostridium sp. LP20]|uniref:helix-turn-helix domain-containing protein n=1 Tax=Clostridium sp. LP20 TaxID=3418665 RepID=UPI003EE4A5BE